MYFMYIIVSFVYYGLQWNLLKYCNATLCINLAHPLIRTEEEGPLTYINVYDENYQLGKHFLVHWMFKLRRLHF